MRTFIGKECSICYNSDLSGDLIISKDDVRLYVPANDILNFVANYIRNEKISKLENMSNDEILNELK